MSLTPESAGELQALCDSLIDENISDQEIARLNELLASSEEALDFYVQYLWMNEGIHRRFGSEEATWLDSSQFQNVKNEHEQDTASLEGNMLESVSRDLEYNAGRRSIKRRLSSPGLYWVAAAICVVITGAVLVASWPGDEPAGPRVAENPLPIVKEQPVDKEQRNEDWVAEERQNRPENEETESNDDVAGAIRNNAVEKKTLNDGTILIAKRGSQYEIATDRQLKLQSGELYLIVAKSDQPFVVETANGDVKATGTRFAVATGQSDSNQTTATVSQGSVILTNPQGNVELGAGQQGTIVTGERPIRGPAPRLSHVVNWAKQALKQQKPIVDEIEKENGLIAIDPYGQQTRLSLRKYTVDVYIEDGIARTTIDQTFFNHNPWNTEGTFYFPLPPDASVSRLAMYVNGKLNEGGMVTRSRGQEIYTDILYQRRDPALLEMMEGNTFKMRIFPLEGRQEKRILLSYTQPLSKLYGTERYWFPMDHTNDIAGEMSIHVRVKDGAAEFETESSTHELKTHQDGEDLILDFNATNTAPDQDFLLSLLPQKKVSVDSAIIDETGPISIVKSSVAVCEHEDNNYLFARITPQLNTDTTPQPRQWIVLNDISGSRSEIELQTQLHILHRLMQEADDDDTVFRIDLNTMPHSISKRPVHVRSEEALRDITAKPVRLIGATDMAAGLTAARQVIQDHQLENPHIVYLGDGVATDGEKRISELPRKIPDSATFVGIGVGKRIDSLFLQEAADRSGGMFVTINPDEDVDWRVFDLLSALNTPRLMKVNVQLLDENDRQVGSVAYPNRSNLSAGEELSIVALCENKKPTTIELTGRINDESITRRIDISQSTEEADFIPRLWAKRHIDELLKSDMPSKEEIIRLSKNYYVVTPYTSLIVLEDDAMYQEYDVERGRKDHWARYPAPPKIEVVKEPINWNRWGWYGNFESSDSKVKANSNPQSIQEIVDGVQLRVDAPFYIWPSQPFDSRTPLYSLCDLKIDDPSELSKMLTISYLLAADDRQPILDWSSEAASSKTGRNLEFKNRGFSIYGEALQERLVRRQLPILPGLQQAGRPFSSTLFKSVSPRFRRRQLNSVFYERIDFRVRELNELAIPSNEFESWETRFGIPNRFDRSPELYRSFGNAVSNRWQRINQDVRKFNRQHGYWNGAIRDGWNSFDFNGVQDATWVDAGLTDFLDVLDVDSEALSLLSTGRRMTDFEDLIMPTNNWRLDFGRVPQGQNSSFAVFSRPELIASGGGRFLTHDFFVQPAELFGTVPPSRQPIELKTQSMTGGESFGFYSLVDQPLALRPLTFFAISQSPLRLQPGTASVLAADLLLKRRDELQIQSLTAKGKNSELNATQAAISAVGKVGSTLESKKFWGRNGWNFQPRPQNIQPPVMQTYQGYDWSFDLTQYATGLNSDTTDMLNEVVSQFGTSKPRGKVSENASRLIKKSRQNLSPMNISVTENGPILAIGPNDRFALGQQSEMSLREELRVNGDFYIQSYEELGLAARRPASEIQLADLRKVTPFLLPPTSHLRQDFDVELLAQNNESFRLQMTPVKEPEISTNDADATTASNPQTEQQSKELPNRRISLILVADHNGMIQRKELHIDDKVEWIVTFERTENEILTTWKTRSDQADEQRSGDMSESGLREIASFSLRIQDETPTSDLFEFDERNFVVIDMPLRKPGFYQDQIHELAQTEDSKKAEDITSLEFAEQDRTKAINLLYHLGLAHLQEYNWRRWGRANQTANAAFSAAFRLKSKLDQPAILGDVALAGSAGYGQLLHSTDHYPTGYFDLLKNDPLTRYFVYRHNDNLHSELANAGKGLVSHLASFSVARRNRTLENINRFNRDFDGSPLQLILANESGFEGLIALSQKKDWAGTAFLLAAHQAGDESRQKAFAAQFWKQLQQMPSLDGIIFHSDQIARTLKAGDHGRFKKFLNQKLSELEASPTIVQLLGFAERLSVWNETEFADRVYKLAEQKLAISEAESATPLLNRMALGYAYWAGNRFKLALTEFQKIRTELTKKEITLSPSLLAAIARLAQQAGDHELAVDLEERAMIAEIPYLPDTINLNAYRQRYQWLWSQYVSAIKKIKTNDPDKVEKLQSIVDRASSTWDRWRKIDGSNTNLPTMMADLLKSADRNEEECWAYLSTVIDDKPKDSNSYFQVAQWYRGKNDLNSAIRFYSQAPRWDTANPRWIYEYGIALKEMGEKKSANEQFNKIVGGKWAAGLQRWVDQAKAAIE